MDEWTLSQNMAADTANGGLNQLEEHYKTFIVSCRHAFWSSAIFTLIFRRRSKTLLRLLALD